MTATRSPPAHRRIEAGTDSAAAAITPTLRETFRRRRAWIVIAAVLVLGALVVLIVQGGARAPGPILGADNPAPPGSKALVAGAPRTRRRRARGANGRGRDRRGDGAARRCSSTTRPGSSGPTASTSWPRPPTASCVAEPGFGALEALAPGVRLAGAASGPIDDVACTAGPAERAEALSGGQRLLTVDDEAAAAGWQGCFRDGEFGYALVTGPGASGGEVALVAATTVFENEHVDESGNAALAIGLLGASDELVWYLPGPGDADAAEAPTLAELTPGWVSPVMVLAIAVTIAAGVWRGRRFGPLVVERLPVQVPAGETSEGRARLYARSASRGHALDQLRIGAIGRIAAVLRLPRSAPVEAVAEAAAHATGRDAASVARLLVGGRPAGDRELVDLAAELDRLEHDVAASVRPRPDDRTDPTGRRP